MRPAALCLAACALSPVPALAAPEDMPTPRAVEQGSAVLYTGLGLSRVSTDYSNLSDALNLGLFAGAQVPYLSWLSGEVDFSFTVAPGNNHGTRNVAVGGGTACTLPPSTLDPDGFPDGCDAANTRPAPGTTASQNDLQMTNLAAFAVLRTPGRVFAVAKYGYRYLNTSIDEIDAGDQTGTAYSVGAGWRWRAGLSKFEAAYTRYSEHLDYLTVGVAYGFGALPESGPRR
jgi:hypothetical protein